MEFDMSKVYTAANADELKIGSKFIGAESLAELKRKVHNGNISDIYEFIEVFPENLLWRFHGIRHPFHLAPHHTFCLAYLIEEEPDEKKLKWTDLNVGDVIMGNSREYMVVAIDHSDSKAHVRTYKGWLTDKELENFKKI